MPHWASLLTEQQNPASERIDEVSTIEMLSLMNEEDQRVPIAVAEQLPQIAQAVDIVSQAFRLGGRLFYLGAGTSGRLGILDASECPPTFRAPHDQVQGLIAGGPNAVFSAVEGAEDDLQGAISQLEEKVLTEADVVMGIAASGVTPYVLGGLKYARKKGCATLFFTCSPQITPPPVDVQIAPRVGAEVLTGSTRLKAGTATKLVLNMLTTGAMVRCGKTYGNLMVDLHPSNKKLIDRSQRIFTTLTGASQEETQRVLTKASGDLKVALVMSLCDVSSDRARQLLTSHDGSVKKAVLGSSSA